MERADAQLLRSTCPRIHGLYWPVTRHGDDGRPASLPTAPDADRNAAAEHQQRGRSPTLLLHGDAGAARSGAAADRRAAAASDTGGASSVEEVTLLLRAASAPKYKAAFATAYRPGLRVSEGVALKVCDVVAASSGKGPLTTRPSKVAPISAMRQIPAICHAPPICRRGASAR